MIEMSNKIPFDIDEALKSGFYICGTTGSGKSDLAMYAANELIKKGVTVVVFDSTQDWINRSNIPQYITVNVLDTPNVNVIDTSTIYDIHELFANERQKFVEQFCMSLYQHQARQTKPKQYFVIFEEAQTYFWQGSMRSNKARNTVMVLTEGRNYKIRFGLITQFASMVDKDALKYCKQRYFGWTDEKNDVEYIKGFIGETAQELRNLKAGQFIYSYPSQNILSQIGIQPHVSDRKPRRVYAEFADKPKNDVILKPKLQASQTAGQALIFLFWLLFMLWLFLRR